MADRQLKPDRSLTDLELPREPGDGEEEEEDRGAIASAASSEPIVELPIGVHVEEYAVDESLVNQIVALGFNAISARRALRQTQVVGVETSAEPNLDDVVSWLLDHQDDDQWEDVDERVGLGLGGQYDEMISQLNAGYKMVFVVNNSLKMGLGKVAAQVGHATLGLYRALLDSGDSGAAALSAWDSVGETKVVLKADSDAQLLEVQRQAHQCGLPTYLVRDAGRTQIAAGSMTVLSIFGSTNDVDKVTGEIKLL